jgi:hypothetical protein
MAPDPSYLLRKSGIQTPLIGMYDAPDPGAFAPLVAPAPERWACVFMFYRAWLAGKTVHLTHECFGCGGAGTYLFGLQSRTREEYIDFLVGEEGLKADGEVMGQWIDTAPRYRPRHGHVLFGPLRDEQYENLKTVTFLVDPDQLSLLITGAHYRRGPAGPAVTAPFASGCGLMGPLLGELDQPRAVIGGTDIAMRQYLPREILAFTVTRPMYEELCDLDGKSFLDKRFWQELQEARARQ